MNTNTNTPGWVGPDGIRYAKESDYRDSWGLLDEVCDRLEAKWRAEGNIEALRAAGLPVDEPEDTEASPDGSADAGTWSAAVSTAHEIAAEASPVAHVRDLEQAAGRPLPEYRFRPRTAGIVALSMVGVLLAGCSSAPEPVACQPVASEVAERLLHDEAAGAGDGVELVEAAAVPFDGALTIVANGGRVEGVQVLAVAYRVDGATETGTWVQVDGPVPFYSLGEPATSLTRWPAVVGRASDPDGAGRDAASCLSGEGQR